MLKFFALPYVYIVGVCFITKIKIDSSPLSAAYMRQWTGSALVQIMACPLFGVKPLSKPTLGYCQYYWNLRSKLQWNLNKKPKLFIHENALENVVFKMAAILSRGRWVKECTNHPLMQCYFAANIFSLLTAFDFTWHVFACSQFSMIKGCLCLESGQNQCSQNIYLFLFYIKVTKLNALEKHFYCLLCQNYQSYS